MNPLRSLEEHTHEAYSVHWNQVRRDVFLSASWDDTVKLWTLNGPPNSIRTFAEHAYCVYAAGVVAPARGRVRHGERGLHPQGVGRASATQHADHPRARVRDLDVRLEQVQRLRDRDGERG